MTFLIIPFSPVSFCLCLVLSLFSFRMSRQRPYTFGLQKYTETAVNHFLCNARAFLPNCTALYPRKEVHIDSCENLIYHKRDTFCDNNPSTQYRPTSVT
jgi:hypothetical protein